jgi:uncharacterized protein YlxP (DUF503 family)
MVVGVFQFELHLPESRSLKDKRRLVKSVLTRLKAAYNICATEIDYHDLRQRATIGVACISTSDYQAQELFSCIQRDIEMKDGLEITDKNIMTHKIDLDGD